MQAMKRWVPLVLAVAAASVAGAWWYWSMGGAEAPEGVELVLGGLEAPWALDFSEDGRLFFTERVGRVGVVEGGEARTLLTLDVVAAPGEEGGLLGLALHPGFSGNRLVYLYYTYRDGSGIWNRVSRFEEGAQGLVNETVVLDGIPAGRIHDGGRIKFGPDGKLYVTTGETGRGALAQDLGSLAGKILRINPDGTVPEDNPFPGSPVYSYGHRNPQGLAWHPLTGALYSTEHGPSGEGLQFAHDEINLIEPGGNYGWPEVIGAPGDPRFVDPVYQTGGDTWAPSGAAFYSGTRYPGWGNALLVATLRGQHLRLISFKSPGYVEVESSLALYQGVFGRLRDVAQGPDGYIYLCTSNRDGRGTPGEGDDRILRIRRSETG